MCLCDMIVTTGTKVDFVHDWEDFLAAQHCILSSLFHLLPFTMTFFFFHCGHWENKMLFLLFGFSFTDTSYFTSVSQGEKREVNPN